MIKTKILKIQPYEKLKICFEELSNQDFCVLFECAKWSVRAVDLLMQSAAKDFNFYYEITQQNKDNTFVLLTIKCYHKKFTTAEEHV